MMFIAISLVLREVGDVYFFQPDFHSQKADDKIFVCKFSENVTSQLFHIEKTRGQTL